MEKYRKNLKTVAWIMVIIGVVRFFGYLNVLSAIWLEDPSVADMAVDMAAMYRAAVDEAVRVACGVVALQVLKGKLNRFLIIPAAVVHIAVTAVVQHYALAIFNIILCILPILAVYYAMKLGKMEREEI